MDNKVQQVLEAQIASLIEEKLKLESKLEAKDREITRVREAWNHQAERSFIEIGNLKARIEELEFPQKTH